MLYNNWLETLAERYGGLIRDIQAEFNFDYGPEFEVALATFLRRTLPERYGVCRGFVAPLVGKLAGDDIIIYDKHRFPTLRGFGIDLTRKESVPAEAVLAYIEAKHTLTKESLRKALNQAAAVKQLKRRDVPLKEIVRGLTLGRGFLLPAPPPGSPDIRNPWYTGIVARRLDSELDAATTIEILEEFVTEDMRQVPDLISAGQILGLPTHSSAEKADLRRFAARGTDTTFCELAKDSFPIAVCHLLWAIETIELPEVPWERVFAQELGDVQTVTVTWSKFHLAKDDD